MTKTYYKKGTWNAICDVCGFEYKADEMRKNWKGLYVCKKDFETRHPQDYLRARPEHPGVPWARTEGTDVFVKDFCYLEEKQAIADVGVASCMVASAVDYRFTSPSSVVIPVYGDHPAGDGLTRLQSAFAGASTADISTYLIGSGTNTGVTINNGSVVAAIDSTTDRYQAWSDTPGLVLSNISPLTAEFLFKIDRSGATPSGVKIAQFNFGSLIFDISVSGTVSSQNKIYIPSGALVGDLNAHVYTEGSSFVHHIALVARTTGYADIYYDGVYIRNAAYGADAASHQIQLGGNGAPGQTVTVTYTGVRVRRAEMYTGTSFTPPTSPAAWGLP